MPAGWTASGGCTSGSTAHPKGATRRESGGADTTSTSRAEPPQPFFFNRERCERREKWLISRLSHLSRLSVGCSRWPVRESRTLSFQAVTAFLILTPETHNEDEIRFLIGRAGI